jgi:quinol monooxygenase YgiN
MKTMLVFLALALGLGACGGSDQPQAGATDPTAEDDEPIYSIWESRFPATRAAEGLEVTKAIWRDMQSFEGYLNHELLVDADNPGHLLVVSQWASRERADETLRVYATHHNARAANSLVAEPRRRILATRADR